MRHIINPTDTDQRVLKLVRIIFITILAFNLAQSLFYFVEDLTKWFEPYSPVLVVLNMFALALPIITLVTHTETPLLYTNAGIYAVIGVIVTIRDLTEYADWSFTGCLLRLHGIIDYLILGYMASIIGITFWKKKE